MHAHAHARTQTDRQTDRHGRMRIAIDAYVLYSFAERERLIAESKKEIMMLLYVGEFVAGSSPK